MGKTLPVTKGDVEFKPLTEATIKRGKDKDSTYFAPLDWAVGDFIKFWGESKIKKVLLGKIKTMCQSWHDEATDDGGNYDQDSFLTMFSNFSARGESVASIKEQIMECAMALSELEFDTEDPMKIREVIARQKEIKTEMKALYADLQNKRRKTKEDMAEEAAGVPTTA